MCRNKVITLLTLIIIGVISYTSLPMVQDRIRQKIEVIRLRRQLVGFKIQSNMSEWSFSKTVNCPNFSIHDYPDIREAISLQCDSKPPGIVSRISNLTDDVFEIPFGHKCLKDAIDSSCSDNRLVPNIVHYVWYNRTRMNFFHFLSFMSAATFVKPCLMLLHGAYLPYGPYWDYFVRVFPYIIHVKRDHIKTVGANKLAFAEHGSDVMRIEALRAYGGLYLDWDEVVLRPVDKFRDYYMTMGEETRWKKQMGSQFIMATPGACFLELWYKSYMNDYKTQWTYNALIVPFNLARRHPHWIHVEKNLFCRPDWFGRKRIFDLNFDWSKNYAMHLYSRWYKRPINETVIRHLKTTLGSVSRHILFGNKELCK